MLSAVAIEGTRCAMQAGRVAATLVRAADTSHYVLTFFFRLSLATMRVHPVEDLHSFLRGRWVISRMLWDEKRRQRGEFRGIAALSPDGGMLIYRERGRMRFGVFDGLAYRTYRYEFTTDHRACVRFDDGRLFHSLDLTRGSFETSYKCGTDEYVGAFTVSALDRWRSRWRVRGARKDLLIDSRYVKADAQDTP